jgi:uncharacterized membrane protein
MKTTRLEAYSDAVIAIVITIMVLEMKVPRGAEWGDLAELYPVFLSYVMSFAYLAIYWNNHHHMLHLAGRINGSILWANMLLLFWLSLFPFVTGWMGENHFARAPTIVYGAVLLLAAISYFVLQGRIIAEQWPQSALRAAIGNDVKGKVSPLLYVTAIASAFVNTWIAIGIYAFVALMWLVPDSRIESHVRAAQEERTGRGR